MVYNSDSFGNQNNVSSSWSQYGSMDKKQESKRAGFASLQQYLGQKNKTDNASSSAAAAKVDTPKGVDVWRQFQNVDNFKKLHHF